MIEYLDGAISSRKGDAVVVFIANKLDLKVTTLVGVLHDENGASGNLILDLRIEGGKERIRL